MEMRYRGMVRNIGLMYVRNSFLIPNLISANTESLQ